MKLPISYREFRGGGEDHDLTMIWDILKLIKDNNGIELKWFNKVYGCVLADWSRKINRILKHIRAESITNTNI